MRILTGILLTALCLSSPAFAADIKLLTTEGEKTAEHSLTEKGGAYTYDIEVGETATRIALDPETAKHVTRIDYVRTTSWAVGEDGPWWPIPDSDMLSESKEIALDALKDGTLSVPEEENDKTGKLEPTVIEAAKVTLKNDKDVPEPDRWIALLGKCDGNDGSPCYSYTSARTIRYTLDSGKQITVTINYPGGC